MTGPHHTETIAARGHWSRVIKKGERLRIIDSEGEQAVDFLCYNAGDPSERYHMPNTIKKAGTILLTTGHVIYSDQAQPMFTIVEDTFVGRYPDGTEINGHDTIGGCCSRVSNEMMYGKANDGCRESFLAALEPYGLGWKDIVANINWFMAVPVAPDGQTEVALGTSNPGDYVTLRAEMDVLAVISNCPQVLNPCNNFNPTPIAIEIFAAQP